MALTTVDFIGHGLDGNVNASGVTYGEVFQVDRVCTLTALRIDFRVVGGAAFAMMRLYRRSDSALLSSATSPSLVTGFATVDVPDVALAANTDYVVAWFDTNARASPYARTAPHTHLGTNVIVTLPLGNHFLVNGDVCPTAVGSSALELGIGVIVDSFPLAPLTPYVPAIML